jgi:hypothetical protein
VLEHLFGFSALTSVALQLTEVSCTKEVLKFCHEQPIRLMF